MGKSNINYIQYGEGKDVVLLHGWGQNIEMMDPLGKKIINHKITIVDLPGFGKTEEPPFPYEISDYADKLKELLDELKIKNPVLIGHSFGGRVAIKYASRYSVDKLILLASPCVRTRKLSKKEQLLKGIKKLPLMDKLGDYMKKYIGSTDYKNATPLMRDVLVNTVNEDLSEDAKIIKAATLLIWGTNDEAAPIEDAYILEKLLSDGGLIKIDGCTHYAYLEAIDYVANIINNFIEVK